MTLCYNTANLLYCDYILYIALCSVVTTAPCPIVHFRFNKITVCNFLQAPVILSRCISPITGYLVAISFDGSSFGGVSVPSDVTTINMSDYFTGHPLAHTLYTIGVTALSDGGGRSDEVSIMHGKVL